MRRVHASIDQVVEKFQVRKFYNEHTYGAEKNHKQSKSRWIAIILKDRISHHCGTMPSEIRIDTLRDFRVDISSCRSWKGDLALEEIQGSWLESYSLLSFTQSNFWGLILWLIHACSVKQKGHSQVFSRHFNLLSILKESFEEGIKRKWKPLNQKEF